MIVNWIKNKLREDHTKVALKEITDFLAIIKDKDDQDVAMLVAIATLIRLNLAEKGNVSKEILEYEASAMAHAGALLYLSKLIRGFQKHQQPFDAAGGMVWQLSMKAQRFPELRDTAGLLWGELARGFPFVEEKLKEIAKLTGNKTPKSAKQGYQYIPACIELP